MLSIAIGKISVAFLIERIAGSSDWRKRLLRGISISIFVSAVITFTLFYAQCQPTRAIWDKGMIKEGTGHCWNPIPVNTWNLVIASKSTDISAEYTLSSDHSRLLGVSGLRSCPHPCRHRVEASVGDTEQSVVDPSAWHGHLVGDL